MTDDLELDYDDLAALLRDGRASSPSRSPRTPSAPRPTSPDRRARPRGRGARLGRRRPLRAARADRRRRLGRRRPRLLAVQVLRAAPGLAFGKRELLESWRPYKVRPAANDPVGRRFELGTPSTSCSRASSRPSTTSARSAGTRSSPTSARSASASSRAPGRGRALRPADDGGPRADVLLQRPGRAPQEVATLLAERDLAVWHGDYYAVETMKHLGLEDGAVRAGIVHYNTEDEVDRLLDALAASRDVAEKDYSGTPLSQKLGAKPGPASSSSSRRAATSSSGVRGAEGDARSGGRALDRVAEEGGEDRGRPHLRGRAGDRPRARPRRQQVVLDRRALAGASLRLPARGPLVVRAAGPGPRAPRPADGRGRSRGTRRGRT